MNSEEQGHIPTAREMGLVTCTECLKVWSADQQVCERCGHHLHSRDPLSLQKVWAWWLVGLICYVPANIEPMLHTTFLAESDDQTIVGGAVELWKAHSYIISLVILAASVAIPFAKFVIVAMLAFSVSRRSRLSRARRQMLFEIVEFIGRWSMIDVCVVAILSSLVHLGGLVSILPGPGSLFFALTVITTMLSARAFDSRLIWDADEDVAESQIGIAPPPGGSTLRRHEDVQT